MTDAMRVYENWLEFENLNQEIRKELLSLTSEEEIRDRFYKNLEFGTGGLRGILGAGTNRMNIYTVRKASQGFADYINENFNCSDSHVEKAPSVAISYDSRINSDLFAMEAAKVLMGNGIKVYLYSKLMPTPALSFAVRYYKCNAGIMVTASHNPAKYNGYKVYNEEGCQMTLDAAARVLDKIENLDIFHDIKIKDFPIKEELEQYLETGKISSSEKYSGLFEVISEEVTEAFLSAVIEESTGAVGVQDLSVVYTPLNGTGNLPVREILDKIGVKNVAIVKEQENPDGNFPTCPYPNPEKKEALELGLLLCKELSNAPDLLLATDPDCDRVGIAIRHQDKNSQKEDFSLLTGNQVGILLLDFICQRRSAATEGAKPMPENPIAIKTIVSSKMVDEVAKSYGVAVIDVLTGFKFIGEQIGFLEKKDEEERYIFGYEESYGYLSGTYVRDKDAVNASMLICEMTAYYKIQGKTLIDRMNELYEKHGYFKEELLDFTFEGSVGMEQMLGIINTFREAPITRIIGKKVKKIADYFTSQCTHFSDGEQGTCVDACIPISLPKSDVLEYILEDGSSFMIRPSGTEPKLKIYLSAKGETQADSDSVIQGLKEELSRLIAQ